MKSGRDGRLKCASRDSRRGLCVWGLTFRSAAEALLQLRVRDRAPGEAEGPIFGHLPGGLRDQGEGRSRLVAVRYAAMHRRPGRVVR